MTALGQNRFRRRIGTIVVLGVVLTSLAFWIARVLEDQRIVRELEIGTTDRIAAVQRGIDEQLRMLDSLAAYWTVSDEVDNATFRAFVTPLFPEDSHLSAIGWAPAVSAADRAAMEASTRLGGAPDFRITERDPQGGIRPADAREFYVPVQFIEPLAGNEVALGFDLWSEEYRRIALQAARDSGRPHTTHRLHLVQNERSGNGLLSALAVYRPGAKLESVSDRREALVGFVSQVYLIDNVIEAGLASLVPAGINLYFLDPLEGAEAGPIHVHRSRAAPDSVPVIWSPDLIDTAPGIVGKLDVGGRKLSVVGTPAHGFVAARRGPLPWVLLVVGLLATALSLLAIGTAERRNEVLHRAHAELKQGEVRLRNVVENMPILMNAIDADGRIVAWNKECERVAGYSASEIQGNPELLEQLYPELLSVPTDPADLGKDDYLNTERTLTARDGGERTIAWSNVSNAIPVPGWASWRVGIDVTDRKLADRERREMHEQLLQIQKLESLGLLAGGIAHDFNNLLTVILGNASLARDMVDAEDVVGDALDGVVQASERATLLTEQLLAYTGRGNFEMLPIDLSEHVHEIGSLLEAAIPKTVALHFDLASELPAVNADPAQVQQLVMNLVINGAEAAQDRNGSVFVRTSMVEVDQGEANAMRPGGQIEPGPHVCLEVQDNGHGMDSETLARIFDPFFSTKFTGRGLGLAAALGIVRGHGGNLAVDSREGSGSNFRIMLPAIEQSAVRRSDTSEHELEGSGLVLVVDDEPMIRRLASRTLTDLGYDVVTASDGLEAIDVFRARAEDVDCVLLDLTMPKLGGEEARRAILAIRPDATVILSSGYDEAADSQRQEAQSSGGFLKKPYTAKGLGTKVKQAMASRDEPASETRV